MLITTALATSMLTPGCFWQIRLSLFPGHQTRIYGGYYYARLDTVIYCPTVCSEAKWSCFSRCQSSHLTHLSNIAIGGGVCVCALSSHFRPAFAQPLIDMWGLSIRAPLPGHMTWRDCPPLSKG